METKANKYMLWSKGLLLVFNSWLWLRLEIFCSKSYKWAFIICVHIKQKENFIRHFRNLILVQRHKRTEPQPVSFSLWVHLKPSTGKSDALDWKMQLIGESSWRLNLKPLASVLRRVRRHRRRRRRRRLLRPSINNKQQLPKTNSWTLDGLLNF